MISRRNVLKLGAMGLSVPVILAGCGSDDKTPPVPTETPVPTEIPPAEGTSLGERTITEHVTHASNGTVSIYQGDPARTGAMPGAAPVLDYPIVVKWKYDLSSGQDFTANAPVVIDDLVYFTLGRDLVALSSFTGQEVWRFAAGQPIGCVPTAANGILFVGSNDDHLYAIDAKTGQGIWKSNLGNAIHGSPAVVDNTVFTSTIGSGRLWENGTGRSTEGMIIALDAATGDEKWRFVMEGASYCAPAVSSGIVYGTSTFGNVYALDASSGDERWKFRMSSGGRTSPCVGDASVYVGGGDYMDTVEKNLYALDANTGDEIWRFPMGDMLRANPSAIDGVVYFGSDDGITYAVDAQTGREKWRTGWSSGFHSGYSVSVVDGIAFQGLRALNPNTGVDIPGYEYEGIEQVSSGPRQSQAIVDGVIYVGTLEYLFAIGNLLPILTRTDVSLRGAPSPSGVARTNLAVGDEIDRIVSREDHSEGTWLEVVVGSETGWIPLDAIDPATLPPEGEIEYVYIP